MRDNLLLIVMAPLIISENKYALLYVDNVVNKNLNTSYHEGGQFWDIF